MKIAIFFSLSFTLFTLSSCENPKVDGIEPKEIRMEQEKPVPEYLYKIVSPEQWQQSQQQNKLVLSPMDKDFVHLATKEQLLRIAEKYWKNQDYIVLKLDTKKMAGRLVYEANPGGSTLYYHFYEGNIPLDAVVDVSEGHTINN